MGAYVSTENCVNHYGVEPNCTVTQSQDGELWLGEASKGNFEGDPDIAGAGVLVAFFSVTAFSVFLAIISTLWWILKNIFGVTRQRSDDKKAARKWKISITGIIEALIISCSDQQIFTGGAYAITLRYAKACHVSAYHYNIVSNILLVTCATHLMSVTVARHYWDHPFLGALRFLVTTMVFVLTGILISNQGSSSLGFPTEIPSRDEEYSLMLLPAACFQTSSFQLGSELSRSFRVGSFQAFFTGQFHGWANYVLMMIFYFISVAVTVGREVRRGLEHDGKRKRFVNGMQEKLPFLFKIKKVWYVMFAVYMVAGIGISSWTVAIAARYVYELRDWLDKSGWIELVHNHNPENDPTTFGQLVPLLLMSLTIFSFMQIVSEQIEANKQELKRSLYDSIQYIRNMGAGADSPDGGASTHDDRESALGLQGIPSGKGQCDHTDGEEKRQSQPTVAVTSTQPASGTKTPPQDQTTSSSQPAQDSTAVTSTTQNNQ